MLVVFIYRLAVFHYPWFNLQVKYENNKPCVVECNTTYCLPFLLFLFLRMIMVNNNVFMFGLKTMVFYGTKD